MSQFHPLLFAMIEADPTPIIAAATARLADQRGPMKRTSSSIRFGSKGSFWIDTTTGGWHDFETQAGGGSWMLAQYVGLSDQDIARLYGVDLNDGHADPRQLRQLRIDADRRRQAHETDTARRRRRRHDEAERLHGEATPAGPGDPASRYLVARGITSLTGIRYHQGPTITTREGRPMRLGPSVMFPVTDGSGGLCAVHCVQIDPDTDRRLSHAHAKISIGSLTEGYVRFGPRSHVVCLGEGAETVASVHEVLPHWRCLASCSSIRLVEADRELRDAAYIILLAERGMEENVRELGARIAAVLTSAVLYIAFVPKAVSGEKADMNDVLQASPTLVRYALSCNQLERIDAVA